MSKISKERLDVLLVAKGLVSSHERAKSPIMAGLIFVDGQKIDIAGIVVLVESKITVSGDSIVYVSRGGLASLKSKCNTR